MVHGTIRYGFVPRNISHATSDVERFHAPSETFKMVLMRGVYSCMELLVPYSSMQAPCKEPAVNGNQLRGLSIAQT
jgi:hypothetical protein